MAATIYPGLAGINIATSQIASIDGIKGELLYRGYDIRELADRVGFEEVTYLLWNDDLPNRTRPDAFRDRHAGTVHGKPYLNSADSWAVPAPLVGNLHWSIPYRNQPYFVSEFGGIWWNPDVKTGEDSWGYGDRPRDLEEFYDRFEKLCAILLDDVSMFGYCYTQLTDIYQEQNGIYKFDRGRKFDLERIRAAQIKPAAIELAEE